MDGIDGETDKEKPLDEWKREREEEREGEGVNESE